MLALAQADVWSLHNAASARKYIVAYTLFPPDITTRTTPQPQPSTVHARASLASLPAAPAPCAVLQAVLQCA